MTTTEKCLLFTIIDTAYDYSQLRILGIEMMRGMTWHK